MEKFSAPANAYQSIQQDNSPVRESDAGTLNDIQQKLRFAGREILRMEYEGGPPLSEEETARVYDHFQLTRHVEKIFFNARARRGLLKSR
ncbi:MAG: hypothetical protein Dbin4_01993 [Alphaproteobacteria bacterium]|nr:hypothetical protein [Alphaproteobacteria bacterium]